MTYRERYAETISSFTKDQLLQEEREQKALITVFKDRLENAMYASKKSILEAQKGFERARIRLDEIRKKLGK